MSDDREPKGLRPYTKPRIFRVALNHEQAVLSQCQLSFTDLKNNLPGGFCSLSKGACRKAAKGRSYDSTTPS